MLVNTSARSLLSGAFQALAAGMDACALSEEEEEERATSGPGRSRMRLLIGSAASLPAVKTSSSAGNNVERDRNMAHTPPDTPMVSTNRNTRIVCGEGGGGCSVRHNPFLVARYRMNRCGGALCPLSVPGEGRLDLSAWACKINAIRSPPKPLPVIKTSAASYYRVIIT